jgi:type VI secretion system secreted protein Hcp
MAAVDMFLKLEGIKGESQDSKHKDEIDIYSYSWMASQTGAHGTGGGGGTGKVSVHDISITKNVDKSTPALWLHCCSGKHIPKGQIVFRKAGDKPLEYLKINMEDILVSSMNNQSSHGPLLSEQLTLNFAKFKIEYFEQKADGSGTPGGEMGWDIKANVKV